MTECQELTICLSYCEPNGSIIIRDDQGRERVIDRCHCDYRWLQKDKAKMEGLLSRGDEVEPKKRRKTK